jgi:hypothetical protein
MNSIDVAYSQSAMTSSSTHTDMTNGTVTFLDVLGWKGIWLRRKGHDVVTQLTKLVEKARTIARGADETNVLSISDTIVLLTTGDASTGLRLHGDIVVELICDSFGAGLPLRGATACGEFYFNAPSILVGAAIDEAASWHEAMDWMGVIQTPSAFLISRAGGQWRDAIPPLKAGGLRSYPIPCADWPDTWRKRGGTRQSLQESFLCMGPFDTSVAAKYTNTLLFYGSDEGNPQSEGRRTQA